eukprot:INCI13361.2.p1 GENE.INCI13361.2~~INCI13361.2.p1  ORF type:complete len:471 (+),score=87.02 INCI13361.2:77-1489(+)
MSVGKMLLIAASCVVASAQMRDRLMMNSRGEPLGARSHPLPPRRAVAKEDFIDVLDYGAVGDNKTDNTAAFQSAIKAAAALDGIQVYVPAGIYIFDGNITVVPGVTLQGSYDVVPSHQFPGETTPMTDGTVLVPQQGRGEPCDLNCTNAFITVQENGAVRGLVIYYQQQERVNTPVSYPWSIFMNANNAAVEDIELLGAWNGIAAVAAHRHYIARVQGQPLNIGLFVDETYDIGRIEDVHWNPWFSNKSPFVHYQTTYGTAFVFGRSDWEYVFNTFAFGYAVGYHFIERATGSMNGNFLGIGMDLATNASVLVDQSQPMGVLITNGEFTAFCDADLTFCPSETADPHHVVVTANNNGAVKFVNSAFWGPAPQIAQVDGKGTVTFSQCHFDAWDRHLKNGTYVTHGTPAISQLGGTLIVALSDFSQPGDSQTHLSIQGGVKTIFTNNVINGPMGIDGNATKQHIVTGNADG